ncbi:hypothetical protein ACFV0C_12525 [Streptomyces sp. NPDC059568]|uniref:hypothetical protein n=1 Tax=unclassified Streptomyces TaxID=2593676 RepID=UPI00365E6AC5
MIARRRPETPDDLGYYLAQGPADTPPEHLAHVAGARWRAEDAIELGKHRCGPADCEVRHWHGRYRHITLPMLTAASWQSRPPAPETKRHRRRRTSELALSYG